VEIENFNSHLIKALEGTESQVNLSRAKTHLQRGALDCYKLLFVEINARIKNYVQSLSVTDVEFALGPVYRQSLAQWQEFSNEIRQARRKEVASTGTDKLEEAIGNYRSAVEHGFLLLQQIADASPRLAEVRHHLFWHSFKTHWPYHLAEIVVAAGFAVLLHSWVVS